jgi:hypothetical protein
MHGVKFPAIAQSIHFPLHPQKAQKSSQLLYNEQTLYLSPRLIKPQVPITGSHIVLCSVSLSDTKYMQNSRASDFNEINICSVTRIRFN